MKGAIFFSGQYGSTAQYADWIGHATSLPVFDVKSVNADPSNYDFLVLGSSVIMYKLTIHKWVNRYLSSFVGKPIILFTVSGARSGPKLDSWVVGSLPESLTSKIDHVALRGRSDPKTVSWRHRVLLRIGAWTNKDPEEKREELEGFDYMDKSSIEPILKLVEQFQPNEVSK